MCKECKHTAVKDVTFSTAIEGYYAIYVLTSADRDQPKLLNVVGWATARCVCGMTITTAYVAQPYSDHLIRAADLDGFISLIGPNPQSDQKANATRVASEVQTHRNARLAEQARSRRAQKMTHPSGRKRKQEVKAAS